MDLVSLGWSDERAESLREPELAACFPARVASAQREIYHVCSERGRLPATISGRVRHEAGPGDMPVVGDWVAVAPALQAGGRPVIQKLLPRRTWLQRRRHGHDSAVQILVANIDTVFVVSALDQAWNPSWLQRALQMVRDGGARPVLVLSKTDLCADPARYESLARELAPDVPRHAWSITNGTGVDELRAYCAPGVTLTLIGQSGAGKSTIVNQLLGEHHAETGSVRARDRKGRHTTTRRDLYLIPSGGLIIDAPGLRELEPTSAASPTHDDFADIASAGHNCQFSDCTHHREPGCAVRIAVEDRVIDAARYEAYLMSRRREARPAARSLRRRRFGRAGTKHRGSRPD